MRPPAAHGDERHRSTPARFAPALAIALALAITLVAAPANASIKAKRVAGGLRQPVAFTFAPDGKIFYVEKASGQIRIRGTGGGDRRFAQVSKVRSDGERGMLGIALHPDYPQTPLVYVYATRRVGGTIKNQILRFRNDGGKARGPKVIFETRSPASFHNGGRILFGPDGRLYAVIGDGERESDAQRLRSDHGKVLRMSADGRIPNDNPLSNRRAFAYGIRNSFGFAFDPQTGDLWETDNGPQCTDEVNRVRPGKNYGWGPHESCAAKRPRGTNRDGPNPQLPLRWYNPTIAPTGIVFCQGCGLGGATEGTALFGAFNTGQVWRLTLNGARDRVASQKVVFRHSRGVLSMEAAPNGRVYFSDARGIHRLVRR